MKSVGSTLENKAGIWKSSSSWRKVENADGTFIIENVSKAKFLSKSGRLISNKNEAQIWEEIKKGEYVALKIYTVPTTQLRRQSTGNQVLTANPNQLTLEG